MEINAERAAAFPTAVLWLIMRLRLISFFFFLLFFVKAQHLVSKLCFNEQPIRRDLPES